MSREWTEHATYVFEYNDIQYELELTGTFHTEMYGQDADGNRGELRTFCDDIEIDSISPAPKSKFDRDMIEDDFYSNIECDDINWGGGPEDDE